MVDEFDSKFKNVIQRDILDIEPSKDIFQAAWDIKDDKENSNLLKLGLTKKISLAAACLMIFSATMVFTVSKDARVMAIEAYNSVRTIFSFEKVGDEYKVVEKSEDEEVGNWHLGGIDIDEVNRGELENKLGYKFLMPEKLGNEFERDRSSLGITIYDIKLRDREALDPIFLKAIGDNQVYKELENYKKVRFLCTVYKDNKGNTFNIYADLDSVDINAKNFEEEVVSKANIEGIECEYVKISCAKYPPASKDGFYSDDITKMPEEIKNYNYMKWRFSGKNYSLNSESGLDFETAKKLATEYIKLLKQQ